MNHPFFEQYKILKDEKWLWIEDPKAWNTMFKKTIGVICLNSLIVFPIVVYILVAFVNKFTVKHTFEEKDLPSKFTLIWQLIFCLLIEDIGFSFFHRLLHSYPYLYKNIHKLHH